ncbi:ACP S-malonyltransferase [Demetria terragena]|uniref:ACP S-malonyltransferase n=1 Tax=Demetria terragena TaxID=63959 RepID=UPI00037D8875|nr:ACP S-malonyltransferase [Demetria terragena]
MLAIVCPGQGSQTPGFLSPWLELPGVSDHLARLSDVAGLDLTAFGTTADEEAIKDTAVAQPLIVAAGAIALPLLFPEGDIAAQIDVTAGHSVGEFTASVVAGVLTDDDAISLVQVRGHAMAEASAVTPTGMSAVLGGQAEDVSGALERHGLTAANMNGGGQVVAAGTLEQLTALADDPPARARVIPLKVAGAFHTRHMATAVQALEQRAAQVTAHDAQITFLSNKDGANVTDHQDALARLVNQVSNPVRWDLCMEALLELGVTGMIELPPAGTLAGLAKRGMRGVETVALKSPDDLEAARSLVREHTTPQRTAN